MAAQKKYICAFCARAFTRSEHKQRHERSHTNEKPFHCSYCTSAFVRRDLLQRHCRTVHNIKLASRAKEKRALSEGSIKEDHLVGSSSPSTVSVQSSGSAPAPSLPLAAPQSNAIPPPPPANGMNGVNNERAFHAPPIAPALAPFPPPNHEQNAPEGSIHRSPNGGSQRPQILPGPQHTPKLSHVTHDAILSPSSAAPLASLHLLQASVAQDPLHLLSLSKNLPNILDSNDMKFPVNDMFLVGNAVLSSERHSVIPNSLANLAERLRYPPSGSSAYDLRMGQVYSILAVGALSLPSREYDSEELATTFINKSWNIIVETLNSAHSSLQAQCDVLKSLFLLTYIYLRFFNNDLMVSYLEDSANIILQNLTAPPAQNELIFQNLELFWSTYVLVSKYKANEAPPKFYRWFLAARLQNNSPITLAQATKSFSKQSLPLEDPFLLEVIICTLANEINNFFYHKTLWLFDSPKSLHNAIVFLNKSMVMSSRPSSQDHIDIFNVFRTKLILNAPPNHEELLQSHIFQISKPLHWNMLLLTLREFNAPFSFNNFVRENLNSSFQSFGNSLLSFFTFESQSMSSMSMYGQADLHVNLGIVSYPLIFQYNFLRLNNTQAPFQAKDLNIVDLANLNNLILEWYITVVKVLVNLITRHSQADAEESIRNNSVLSCLFYMLHSNSASVPPIASTEFYLQAFDELNRVCDTWFNFINQGVTLRTLRINLNRFLNDLVVLALNNDHISIGDIYVANESILIKNRRSKSIGSVEMSGPVSSRSSLSSGFPPPMPANRGASNNYVLMNKAENEAGSPQSFYQISPTSSLAPLQGVTKLNFSSPAGPRVQKPMPHPMNSPPVPGSSTYVLPPIYAAVKDHKPGEMK